MSRSKKRNLSDAYRFEGFHPQAGKLRGVFGKPKARILPLERRSKKHVVENVALYRAAGTIARQSWYEICLAVIRTYILRLNIGVCTAGSVAR